MSYTSRISQLLCLSLLAGCGTQVRLKTPAQFTEKQVRLIGWEDRCRLQDFFDSDPSPNTTLFEVGSARVDGDRRTREYGSTTHRIHDKRQRWMLLMLLSRYYRKVPAIALRSNFTVTVDYYRYCGKPRMMLGSIIRLDAGGRTALLDYHPCVGEYLLNRDIYATRHLHVESTVASKRSRR